METPFHAGLGPTHWAALGELPPALAGAALQRRKLCGEPPGITGWKAQANLGNRFLQCHGALKTW